jgi:starch phosphorylase
MSVDELVALGQPDGAASESPFSMFILGLRTAQYINGVSQLHGRVARHMWSHIWPTRSDDETPITHITNGVHIPTVLAPEIKLLFERHLGPQWNMGSTIPENASRIDDIFDEELWQAHEMCRSRLIRTVRELMFRQYGRRNAPLNVMKSVEAVLDQDVLTIAFARRFATYKRAHLLFQDPDRLEAIINSADRPVQFIFAGKAHPKDNEGKGIIRSLVDFGRRTNLRHRFIFLEDYDLHIARCMVQGADVWLNTPRRPMEACGTSGMKAALNGVLNVSIMDGWWCEGYSPERGWRIGNGEEYQDHNYQDAVESQALYNIIENEVAPAVLRPYGRRNAQGLAEDDEGLHENGHGPVLQPADDIGIRRALLPACQPPLPGTGGRWRRGGQPAQRTAPPLSGKMAPDPGGPAGAQRRRTLPGQPVL